MHADTVRRSSILKSKEAYCMQMYIDSFHESVTYDFGRPGYASLYGPIKVQYFISLLIAEIQAGAYRNCRFYVHSRLSWTGKL